MMCVWTLLEAEAKIRKLEAEVERVQEARISKLAKLDSILEDALIEIEELKAEIVAWEAKAALFMDQGERITELEATLQDTVLANYIATVIQDDKLAMLDSLLEDALVENIELKAEIVAWEAKAALFVDQGERIAELEATLRDKPDLADYDAVVFENNILKARIAELEAELNAEDERIETELIAKEARMTAKKARIAELEAKISWLELDKRLYKRGAERQAGEIERLKSALDDIGTHAVHHFADWVSILKVDYDAAMKHWVSIPKVEYDAAMEHIKEEANDE